MSCWIRGRSAASSGRSAPCASSAAKQEALGARAGALAEVREGDRCVAAFRQQPVERRDEVGRGIEEGPVEVDEHRVHVLPHRPDGAGRRPC